MSVAFASARPRGKGEVTQQTIQKVGRAGAAVLRAGARGAGARAAGGRRARTKPGRSRAAANPDGGPVPVPAFHACAPVGTGPCGGRSPESLRQLCWGGGSLGPGHGALGAGRTLEGAGPRARCPPSPRRALGTVLGRAGRTGTPRGRGRGEGSSHSAASLGGEGGGRATLAFCAQLGEWRGARAGLRAHGDGGARSQGCPFCRWSEARTMKAQGDASQCPFGGHR